MIVSSARRRRPTPPGSSSVLLGTVILLVGVLVGASCGGSTPTDRATVDTATVVPDDTVATTAPATPPTPPPATTAPTLQPILPAVPGPGVVIDRVPGATGKVALTFDDGDCGDCIGLMVAALERTGAHVTFCPNGAYNREWQPYVERIRLLIARGQVVMCNHTWDHPRITGLSSARLTDEIERNERWIEDTFGVSGRPWFRPPYGSHNARTDAVAGSLGYTSVVTWSSTLADSILQPPETVLQQLQTRLVEGGVVLGHLNYPTTGQVFDQMLAILAQRGLTPVTLPELVAAGRGATGT